MKISPLKPSTSFLPKLFQLIRSKTREIWTLCSIMKTKRYAINAVMHTLYLYFFVFIAADGDYSEKLAITSVLKKQMNRLNNAIIITWQLVHWRIQGALTTRLHSTDPNECSECVPNVEELVRITDIWLDSQF